jgi:DNA-binding SARP family transcriptional activator
VVGLRFGVLGPLEVISGGDAVDLKGARQRAVLARLLVAKGRVVPVSWLIDDLWDDPPEGALGAVQTFVGALRKALEPDRPPRTPSRLLVTVAPGYALRTEPTAVDAVRFEAAVVQAGRLLTAGQVRAAHAVLDEALGLWRGPAYAEFADRAWARAEVGRLDELHLVATLRRAEAALALDRAADTVPELEAHVAAHPLREDGWGLLALALYRMGRQGDALGALRRARELLRDELGVDPGPELRRIEAGILAHAPELHEAGAGILARAPQTPPPFVGRADELAQLEQTAAAGTRLALVAGAAGAGKTALVRAFAQRLGGWTVAWGASSEHPGAPAAWPWSQLRAALGDPPAPELASDPGDDPVMAQFRRHRAIAAYLARRAAGRPVLLVFDDLHWADDETLALLTALTAEEDLGPVLLVGTYRSTGISAGLTEALGRAARFSPTRVYLGGLTEAEVGQIAVGVPAEQARVIHARSAGNPFYARELIRLWEVEGEAGLHAVPAGVRDVLRHRFQLLAEPARTHLRQAAVLGAEVDLDLLIALAGDEEGVLSTVEEAVTTGFLEESDADRLRFAHALVLDTLYGDLPRARRARWHATAAEILERTRPGDVETIARHFVRAESRSTAGRAAHYARAAAERAEPHAAAHWWREVIAALDRSGEADARARLDALMGLVRALAVTGNLAQARQLRAEALDRADAIGDPELTAGVLGAFDVPAIWTTNDDEALSRRVVASAEATLAALPAGRDAERARLLVTIAMERRADVAGRGREAAEEAEAIARGLDDPRLLAYALNGRFMQTFHRAGLAPERARVGRELVALAASQPTFEVLGHLILVQANAALADLAGADEHAAAADRLAERHGLPVVGVFTDFYRALRLTATGRTAEAETAYRVVAARLPDTGMSGVEQGILPLALLSLGVAVDGSGPYEPWTRPVTLLARGDREQALAAALTVPESPRDLLFEARTCLHATVAVHTGHRPLLERLYHQLLPAAGELAAGSGLVTFGPVARHLGDLARALGRSREAAEHDRIAQTIASVR